MAKQHSPQQYAIKSARSELIRMTKVRKCEYIWQRLFFAHTTQLPERQFLFTDREANQIIRSWDKSREKSHKISTQANCYICRIGCFFWTSPELLHGILREAVGRVNLQNREGEKCGGGQSHVTLIILQNVAANNGRVPKRGQLGIGE